MAHCWGGTPRRTGLPLPRQVWSNAGRRSLKAEGAGAVGRAGATMSRATRMKEPGD